MSRMTRLRNAPLLALVLALVAIVGACGGDDSRAQFAEDVVAARDRVDSALAQVTQPKSVEDLILRLRIARDEISTAAPTSPAADAPEDLTDEQRRLSASLTNLATEVGGVADALEELGPGAADIRTLNFENWNRVQAALENLRDAGIEVEPLGRHGGESGGSGS